jgi:hypothetical protein
MSKATILDIHSAIEKWATSEYKIYGTRRERKLMNENESKGGGYVGRTMNTSRLNFYDRTLKVSV